MTFTANNGCTYCGSDGHMQSVCPWKGKALTFDLRGFIDALENVRGFHDMSAELIAEQVFEQASAAQSAPDEREAELIAALEHIAKTCNRSRTSTRRLRWIEQRAKWAIDGKPYDRDAFDLPKEVGNTAHRLSLEVARLKAELAESQRAQSAPVVPEGWRVSVVDYGNRTGEASISGPGVYCMQVPVSYSMLDFMQALAASYRRNQSEPAAHEGWRLVPVEPTEEMIDAGCREHTCVQGDSWYSDSEISEHDAIAVFKAMLAAAIKVAPHG